MNLIEAKALLMLLGTAHDRAIPEGLDHIWAATLADVPFHLAKDAALELLKTSPYLPKIAELRARIRLIKAEDDRVRSQRRQLEARTTEPPSSSRTGAAMIRHVLGRLADAGQNIAEGHRLGRERATAIAEQAAREWLDQHPIGRTA